MACFNLAYRPTSCKEVASTPFGGLQASCLAQLSDARPGRCTCRSPDRAAGAQQLRRSRASSRKVRQVPDSLTQTSCDVDAIARESMLAPPGCCRPKIITSERRPCGSQFVRHSANKWRRLAQHRALLRPRTPPCKAAVQQEKSLRTHTAPLETVGSTFPNLKSSLGSLPTCVSFSPTLITAPPSSTSCHVPTCELTMRFSTSSHDTSNTTPLDACIDAWRRV